MPNINTSTLNITIEGQDYFSDDLAKVNKGLGGFRDQVDKTSKTVGGAGKEIGTKLGGSLTGLATSLIAPIAGFVTLTGAVMGTVNFLKSSVNDWVAYNEEIRKLGIATGASTTDLSRMVQAADDVGVSMDAMKTALRLAAQNGVKPTIANIAKLSDELLAITDSTERAERMQAIFGRGWAEVSAFVLQGSDAIRAGTAAIANGMVVTEESTIASREYSAELDELRDSWTTLSYTIGSVAVPKLTTLLKMINDNGSESMEWIGIMGQLKDSFRAGEISYVEFAKAMLTGMLTQDNAIVRTKYLSDATAEAATTQEILSRAVVNTGLDLQYYTAQTYTAEKATTTLWKTTYTATDLMAKYSAQLLITKASEGLTSDAAIQLASSLGMVDSKTQIMLDTLAALKDRYDENRDGIIDNHEAMSGYSTAVQILNQRLMGLPKTGKFDFYINVHGQIPKLAPPGTGGTGGASPPTTTPGSGQPPPGYTPPGQESFTGSSVVNNFNISLSGSGMPSADLIAAVRLMEMVYGR